MRVKMLSFHRTAAGADHAPGHVVDFDDAEAERLVSVNGARKLTDEETAAELEAEVAAKAAEAGKSDKGAKK